MAISGTAVSNIPISFGSDGLAGESLNNPTSLDFGPDGRLYVTQQNGMIYAYTIARDGAAAGSGSYSVTDTEAIDLVKNIPNHNDDGSLNTGQTNRQVTGILATGTDTNPVLYVTSSDPRIGAGGSGTDANLDTNSGIVSKLTWNGASWDKVDVVRGLPRSEENHATNGMALSADGNTLYVAQGGHTNQGAPSNNFAETPEYSLSAAILSVDLATIDSSHGGSYDLPTVGRAAGAVPFGGNDGATQAVWDVNGPVQVHSPGYRNPYDVVLTQDGNLYTFDNGPNNNWGGIPIACSNTLNENGTETAPDNLHHIPFAGYYGGHPNPTRGDVGLVPGAVSGTPAYDTTVECTYLSSSGNPPRADGSLATVGSSTNGLTEYTATNFSGAMQGDLLAAAFNGNIYRMKPTAAGDDLVNLTGDANNPEQVLFNGFGATPLDVTTQGDGDIFPGTVWAATYGANNITVFEPADFGTSCTGADNPALDEDGDNYDNADEIDNGTDPCSGGSKPTDWDGDFVSDLNDADDDDDLIDDVDDAFALDPSNGLNTTAPLSYPLDLNSVGVSEVPPFGTFKSIGFTGWMLDPAGVTDYLTQFDEDNLNVGGAVGVFSIDFSSTGDATNNDQDNGFQFGVDPSSLGAPFTVHVQTVNPFPDSVTPANFQSVGFFIGTGDQDNYLKLVVAANDGTGGFQLGGEVAGAFTTDAQPDDPAVLGDSTDIDLYMAVDPTVAGDPAVEAFYRINGGPLTSVGSATIPAAWLAGPDALAVGLISTSVNATPITPAWESIEITMGAPDVTAPAAPTNLVATATDGQVSLDWDDNVEGDLDVYSIYRSTTSPVDTSGVPIAQPADSEYLDTLVTNGTTYYYMVTARDVSLNESVPSNEAFDTPSSPTDAALFRVNVGGPAVAAADATTPTWSEDTNANPSVYRTGAGGGNVYALGGNNSYPGPIVMGDPSIPPSVPVDVFETERWDPGASGDPIANEMQWDFPIAAGTEVEVTLLFAELFSGVTAAGDRVFEVTIDGATPAALSNVDPFATAGATGAFAISEVVAVDGDGVLDINFLHGASDNPALKGIEIRIPDPRAIQVIAPTEGEIVLGDEVTVEWTTSGGLLSNDHVHLMLDGPPHVGSLPQNGSYTFTPVAAGPHTLMASVADAVHTEYTNPEAVVMVNFTVEIPSPVLYRVNAGGGELPALDSGPVWAADDTSLVSGSTVTGGFDNTNGSDASVPATTPQGPGDNVFVSERYGDDDLDPMQWDFPVAAGELVEVRLFMHSGWDGASSIGQREFDVSVEGLLILDDYDLVDDVGHRVGVMKSIVVTSDGTIDIDFGHVTQNSLVNAIEIIAVDSNPSTLSANPTGIDFGTVATGGSYDLGVVLTNDGAPSDPLIVVDGATPNGLTDVTDDAGFPIVLFPGEEQPLTITWAPSADTTLSGSYSFSHDGTGSPTVVSIDGVAAVAAPAGTIGAAVASHDFGGVTIGEIASTTLTFTHDGPAGAQDVTIDSITVGDPDVSIVTAPATPFTVSETNSFDVTIEYAPTATGALAGNVAVDYDTTQQEAVSLTGSADPIVAFRVNVGGPLVADAAGDWGADASGSPSPYYVAGGGNFYNTSSGSSSGDVASVVASVPTGTPLAIFNTEQWDATAAPPLSYAFPVAAGAGVEVRIYTAEIYNPLVGAGSRMFDVAVDGAVPTELAGLDPFVLGGNAKSVGAMSAAVVVSDGVVDLEFLHDADNPNPKAIEILITEIVPADLIVNVSGIDFGSVDVGNTAQDAVTVTNPLGSDDDVTISGLSVSGSGFSLASPPGTPFVLQPGDTVNLTVEFAPAAGQAYGESLTVTHNGATSLNVALSGTGTVPSPVQFRANANGQGPIVVGDGGPDWVAVAPDSIFGGITVVGGTNSQTGSVIDLTHPSLPAGTPMAMLQREIYGDTTWTFDVADGNYEVRLYFAETYAPESATRRLNVTIEGVEELSDYWVSSVAGGNFTGVMESVSVTVGDGDGLTVFIETVVNNAAIKGIEIIST